MFTVTVITSGGTTHLLRDVKLSRALSFARNASQFADVVRVEIVNPTPNLPEVKK